MKYFILIIFFLFSTITIFAKTKKAIQILSANSQTKIGAYNKQNEMYTFTIKINQKNVFVDSVWFGNLLIPIDIYEKNIRLKNVETLNFSNVYKIVANKKLFENYAMADTVAMHKNFIAPFPYYGKPVIYYKVNGIRMYEVANKIKVLTPQGLR